MGICCHRRVADAGVGVVLSLQDDADLAGQSLDMGPILDRVQQRGDVAHVRVPTSDVDIEVIQAW